MLRLLCILSLLTVAAAPAFAESVPCLAADFDADALGDWPDVSLPGGPVGDYLEIRERFPSDDTTAYVEASYFGLQDQPLVVDRWAGENIGLNFYTDPDFRNCDAYTVTWRALAGNPAQFFYFSFFGEDRRLKCSVEYRSGGVLTYNSSMNTLDATWSIGVVQEFRLEFDMLERHTSLWIDGVPMPSAQEAPFVWGNADDTLELMILNIGLTSDTLIGLDDVLVTAHCGGVANEDMDWGRLKALYD